MKQEKIAYKDIMDLGFSEKFDDDQVYFDLYGYKYSIVELKLSKRIFADWSKETGLCVIIRVDKEEYIVKTIPVWNLEYLKQMIDFFK